MPKTVKTAVIGIITTAALIMPLAFAGPASAAESTAPTITEFTVSSATFYPTDHDGYPDGVTFNGRASVGTSRLQPFLSWNITVRNSTGATIAEGSGPELDSWARHLGMGRQGPQRHSGPGRHLHRDLDRDQP